MHEENKLNENTTLIKKKQNENIKLGIEWENSKVTANMYKW